MLSFSTFKFQLIKPFIKFVHKVISRHVNRSRGDSNITICQSPMIVLLVFRFMIGKFTGQDTPACGFSIGFERIVMLLLEKDYQIPSRKEKKAFLIGGGIGILAVTCLALRMELLRQDAKNAKK